MGPFVPDLISDQLNLVVALVLGVAFGFVLEQAGFSSSRRLAGLFYGYDFTVLRVFFTAAITAMSGVLLLDHFGLLDTSIIYVNPTWLLPALVGGVIMGVGFILGGYCPGTSVCAAAIGKVDGMFFIGGGVLGIIVFGEFFPLYDKFFASTSMGPVKIYDSLGMSQGVFVIVLILVAVIAFAVTTKIERRVNKTNAPSANFKPINHLAAAAFLMALGILFIFLPDRRTSLLKKVSDPQYAATHPVSCMEPDELAFGIVDHEPNIRIIDIRTASEYAKLPLPGSSNVQIGDFFGKDFSTYFLQRHVKKVIVGENEAQERTACLLLRELGYENIAILQGGIDGFAATILDRGPAVSANKYPGPDVTSFRQSARVEILNMIETAKHAPTKIIKVKKIQGGC